MTETNPPLAIISIGRGTRARTGELLTHMLSALSPVIRQYAKLLGQSHLPLIKAARSKVFLAGVAVDISGNSSVQY